MLAEEFGYQVTPRPASEMTPAVQPEVNRELEATRKWAHSSSGGGAGICLGIAVAALGAYAGKLSMFLIGCAFGILLYLLAGSLSRDKRKGLSGISKAANAALSSPWQVWPCRVEEGAVKEVKLLMLLGPDGTVARTFLSSMSDEVWIGMTDGRGLVWFAGDMRFGGIAALPGGSPIWWVHSPQANATPTASSDRQQRIEEELTRQAIAYVFNEWL